MLMKTLATLGVCLQLFNSCPGTTEPTDYEYGNLYPTTAIVTNVQQEYDIVTVTEYNGNMWQFLGCDDWETGDIVGMIMADSNTDEVWDDVIVKYRYCGHI